MTTRTPTSPPLPPLVVPISKISGKPCRTCLKNGQDRCSAHRDASRQIIKTVETAKTSKTSKTSESTVLEPTSADRRQQRFIEEYLIDLNAAAAARRAGFTATSARRQGWEMLSNPVIAEKVQIELDKRAKRTQITADRVLKELFDRATSNMRHYVIVQEDGSVYLDFSDLTPSQWAAVQEIQVEEYMDGKGEDAREIKKVKFKLHNQTKNLELLGKHLGLFSDRLEVTGRGGGPIEVDHSILPVDRLSVETRRRMIEDLRSGEIDEGEVIELTDGEVRVIESRVADQPNGKPEWFTY